MSVKTSELIGVHLDRAVAVALGYELIDGGDAVCLPNGNVSSITARGIAVGFGWHPSVDWAIAGPIIDDGKISVMRDHNGDNESEGWLACIGFQFNGMIGCTYDANFSAYGATPLVAAMRCFVLSKQEPD